MTRLLGRLRAPFFVAVAALLLAAPARAQGVMQMLGPSVNGHLAMLLGHAGQALDAGGPTTKNGPPANSLNPGTRPTGLGIVNAGLGYCQWTGYANAPYGEFCWGFDGQGNALLQIDQIGGATAPGFNIDFNGTVYSFPFAGGAVGPSSTTIGDLAVWNNLTGTLLKGTGAGFAASGVLSGTSSVEFKNYAGITVADTASNITGTAKLDGLGVFQTFGGGEGNRNAIFGYLNQTAATTFSAGAAYHYFTSIFGYNLVTVGDTSHHGSYYSFGGLTEVLSGNNIGQVKGAEFDTSVQTGATVDYNAILTLDLVNSHAVHASTFEAFISLGADSTVTALMKNGIVVGDPYGNWPIDPTGSLFTTIGATGSGDAAFGIDLRGAGFTSCSFAAIGFCVDGSGSIDMAGPFPHFEMNDTHITSPDVNGGLVRIIALGSSTDSYEWQINTAVAGDFSTGLHVMRWGGNGTVLFNYNLFAADGIIIPMDYPFIEMQDTSIASPAVNGGYMRIYGVGTSSDAYEVQFNTAVAGDFSTNIAAMSWLGNGTTVAFGALQVDGALNLVEPLPAISMEDTQISSPAVNGGLARLVAVGTSPDAFDWQINTAAGGDFSTKISALSLLGDGSVVILGALQADGNLSAVAHIIAAGATPPALTSCGTSPAIVGDDKAGQITMGTGSPTGCVATFNVAYTSAPLCTVSWQGTPLAAQSYAVSTTAITLTQTATSSNKVNYVCLAQSGG